MLILVIITGLLLLGFLGYGLYLYKYKRGKFLEQKSIIEFISIFVSIFFAVLTIYQTTEAIKSSQEDSSVLIKKMDNIISSANNAKNVLDSVSFRLGRLPNELDKFSISIRNLDAVVQTQQNKFLENIQSLKENVGGLSSSIGDYKNYIDNYSIQLKKIVAQTDAQLMIWKEQQEIMKKHYSRKPEISLSIFEKSENDSTLEIKKLIIQNTGDIYADILHIVISIPEQYSLTKDPLKNWNFINTQNGYKQYQYDSPNGSYFSVAAGSGHWIDIELKGYLKKKSPKKIGYSIFYKSYNIDGVVPGEIILFK